jgi:hypothetical protein
LVTGRTDDYRGKWLNLVDGLDNNTPKTCFLKHIKSTAVMSMKSKHNLYREGRRRIAKYQGGLSIS